MAIGKPINRFEFQLVYDSGAYIRVSSRREPPMSRAEVMAALKEYARDFDEDGLYIGKPAEPA